MDSLWIACGLHGVFVSVYGIFVSVWRCFCIGVTVLMYLYAVLMYRSDGVFVSVWPPQVNEINPLHTAKRKSS